MRRGSPGPFVAVMGAELGEWVGPAQVIGRLEQRRCRVFRVPLSLSLHEVHGRARSDRICVAIELN